MPSKNFITQRSVLDVRNIGRSMANFLFGRGIENVMFLDRSARPGYIALKRAWAKKFPGVAPPNIYFTNPEGYNTNNRNVDEIVDEFDATYRRLASNKSSGIMLFDVCMHSGLTVGPILDVLERAGYTNVLVGLAQPPSDAGCKIKRVDFLGLRREADNICYPFRRDNIVEKNRTSVVSTRNLHRGDVLESNELRKEISSLF